MMEVERNFPVQVCFAGEGVVASGSDNGEVLVWDLAQAEVIQVLTHDSERKSHQKTVASRLKITILSSGATLVQSIAVSEVFAMRLSGA